MPRHTANTNIPLKTSFNFQNQKMDFSTVGYNGHVLERQQQQQNWAGDQM